MFGLGLWSLIVLGTGIGSVLALFAYMATGHGVRYSEDRARTFYDEHGHWPDQTPQDVADELEAARAWSQVRSAKADADGLV